MVTWDRQPQIIRGQDPAHLVSILKELQDSEAYRWMIRCLTQEAEVHTKLAAKDTVESNVNRDGPNYQMICDINRNIITAKTLLCIENLAKAAISFCQTQIARMEIDKPK